MRMSACSKTLKPAPTSTQPLVESTKRLLSKSITFFVTFDLFLFCKKFFEVHLSGLVLAPSLIEDDPDDDTWVVEPESMESETVSQKQKQPKPQKTGNDTCVVGPGGMKCATMTTSATARSTTAMPLTS